jgi:hypothetical protein
MTADEHIPRKRHVVKELSAEEAYGKESYLEDERKSRRGIAEREAANRLLSWLGSLRPKNSIGPKGGMQ